VIIVSDRLPSTKIGWQEPGSAQEDCWVSHSLFDPVAPEPRISRRFRDVRDSKAFTAARRLMDEIFAGLRDVDGNFVRDFQAAGFSPRVLELAVFAYLTEQGYTLDRASPSPDFVITGDTPMAIEVTTSNPPDGQDPDDVDPSSGLSRLMPDDLPAAEQKFVFQTAKALRSKLLKRTAAGLAYWEQPHVAGLPFIIALESFHSASSLFHAVGFLGEYLYGYRQVPTYDQAGNLLVTGQPITEHQHKGKVIPSGLFSRAEASHLSAVLFTNSATISKFNRIGTERGYGPADVAMVRYGTVYNPEPNAIKPKLSGYLVGNYGPDEWETFSEGLNLMHNPWAKNPLPAGALRDLTEHRLLAGGRVLVTTSRPEPFATVTLICQGAGAEQHARQVLASVLADDPPDP